MASFGLSLKIYFLKTQIRVLVIFFVEYLKENIFGQFLTLFVPLHKSSFHYIACFKQKTKIFSHIINELIHFKDQFHISLHIFINFTIFDNFFWYSLLCFKKKWILTLNSVFHLAVTFLFIFNIFLLRKSLKRKIGSFFALWVFFCGAYRKIWKTLKRGRKKKNRNRSVTVYVSVCVHDIN